MKVFISWSGEASNAIAEALRDWLPIVIQAVDPYFSPKDTAKGSRWNDKVSFELKESNIGIVILTEESIRSPWVLFEAGALSSNLTKSKVIPILFDIKQSQVPPPLTHLMTTEFSKADFFQTLKTINSELGDQALEASRLNTVFEKFWPEIETEIRSILAKKPKEQKSTAPSDRDVLEEILLLTRRSASTIERPRVARQIGRVPSDDLVEGLSELISALSERRYHGDQSCESSTLRIYRALHYAHLNGYLHRSKFDAHSELFDMMSGLLTEQLEKK